ncbi:hypothetical protein AB0L57_31880 [Nocardia sp. NPDC052254]|uniref:hypothetical protein n=1 Tax=Nocardia sp. NPDC052254 TaxID=3155681 RepID=UPI003427E024
MSETESTQTGRVRRRAGRPAGPPVDGDKADSSVRATAPAKAKPDTQQTTGDAAPAGKTATAESSAETVKLTTEKPAAEDTTAKLTTPAAEDTTAKIAKPAEEKTVKLAKPAAPADDDSDATVKLATADADDSTVEQTTADVAAADAADAPAKRKLGVLGWAAAVVALLSLLGLLGSGGFYFYHQHQVDSLASQRGDYVQTAKQAVLNLTNIKDDSAQQDIDRVLSVASGQLKEEYSSRKDDYAKVVQQAKVKASGEIIEAAVESSDDRSAKVLVAAKQTLTNAGSPDPQQRYYRFRITVTRDGGHTTASKVEFVA